MTIDGLVVKADSGFYYVKVLDRVIECKIRKKLKSQMGKVYPGDHVEILEISDKQGVIEKIFKRKSILIRPPIANADQLIILMSNSFPKIDYNLLDRLIIYGRYCKLEIGLIITKCDQGSKEIRDKIYSIYRKSNISIFFSSIQDTDSGVEIKGFLKNKINILAGPSGVGKSSLLNMLNGELVLKTGSIGEKIRRGRHTTRVVELFSCFGGYVADTPGFSRMELPKIEPEELRSYYYEFNEYSHSCKYLTCKHYHESECGVKEGVFKGLINRERYERYIYFLEEIIETNERRYL